MMNEVFKVSGFQKILFQKGEIQKYYFHIADSYNVNQFNNIEFMMCRNA